MSKTKLPFVVLMALQVIAVILYPPNFFQRAPQAIVLPPALILLFGLAVAGFNTKALSAEGTRTALIFVQGLNVMMRLITILPNLTTASGAWAWDLLIAQLVGIGLSWFSMTALEYHRLEELRFTRSSRDGG